MANPHLRKYGVQTTVDFALYGTDGLDLKSDAVHASGDTKIMKDEGAEANTSNAFTDEGQGYSIVLDATEMQAARIVVYVVDQTTKVWLDEAIIVETYGNASAMHAFDLDTATQGVDVIQVNSDSEAAVDLMTAAKTIVQGTVDDTAFTSTATQFESDDITQATADHYKGRVVIWTSGALKDQATDITNYAFNNPRGFLTVSTMTEAPANNDTFVIV